IPPPRFFPDSSALRSALNSWKTGISSARIFSLSRVSVKQTTVDPWRSLFLPVRRSSSSILLLRERTFARWIEGSCAKSSLVELYQRASFPLRRFRRIWVKQIFEGVDFSGSDIRQEVMDNVELCQSKCDDDPNCQFFSYVDERRLCFLKRVITMPAPPTVNKLANVVSGFSLRNCN
ncbi:hypothetical protein CHARACLAT_032532, partial [Characodon lateralis]|nr:hypothetical protein [Characodon lateralis]